MHSSSAYPCIDLDATHSVRMRYAAGVRVYCIRGELWITQEGDARDIVLGSGSEFIIEKNGLVLVEALQNASVKFQTPLGHEHCNGWNYALTRRTP